MKFVRLSTLFPAAAMLMAVPGLAAAQSDTTAGSQAAADTGYVEVEDKTMMVEAFGLPVSEIEGKEVLGSGGDKIGTVEDVLRNRQGMVVAIVVETEGFLGLGDRDVILGLTQVRFENDQFHTDLDKAGVEKLPIWED